uniref:Uncharacterized protein n=1 Tax=Tetranychus urticae TaxID=32264 RepID=T1KZ83_TETUR
MVALLLSKELESSKIIQITDDINWLYIILIDLSNVFQCCAVCLVNLRLKSQTVSVDVQFGVN